MANYETLKATIAQYIKENHANDISGNLLQQQLLAMVNSLGAGYQFAGIATPSTNHGTPDQNVFYIAGSGTYPNFNSAIIEQGEIGVFAYNGNWTILKIDISGYLNEKIGFAAEKTLDENYFVGMIWNGSAVSASTAAFNGFVVKLVEGGEYQINGTIATIVLFGSYPEIGDSQTLSQVVEANQRFQANQDCYALITVRVENSVVFKTFEAGLTKEVNTLSAIVSTMEEQVSAIYQVVGQPENELTLTSANYSNLIWNGSAVSAAPSSFNGFVVKLVAGRRYKLSSGLQTAITFPSVPTAGMSNLIRSLSGTFIAESTEKYLLITISTSVSSYVFTEYANGLMALGDIGGKLSSGLQFPKSYSGMIWNGSAVSAATSSFNGFVVEVPAGQSEIYFNNLANVFLSFATFTQYPQIGDTGVITGERVISKGQLTKVIFPTENVNGLFILVTIRLTSGFSIENVSYVLANASFDAAVSGLKGKRILCLGDSITEFVNSDGNNYPAYLAMLSGATVYGCGVGGTRLSRRAPVDPTTVDGSYGALDIVSLCEAISTGTFTQQIAAAQYLKDNVGDDNTPQINVLANIDFDSLDWIIVMGGTNDWTGDVPIGTDTDAGDYTNIKGAIRKIFSFLCGRCPNARVLIMAEPPRYFQQRDRAHWCDVYQNGNGDTLSDVITAIMESAHFSHVPVVDLYHNLGWNEFNFDSYFKYESTGIVDLTHPYSGLRYIAEMAMKYIKNCYY